MTSSSVAGEVSMPLPETTVACSCRTVCVWSVVILQSAHNQQGGGTWATPSAVCWPGGPAGEEELVHGLPGGAGQAPGDQRQACSGQAAAAGD